MTIKAHLTGQDKTYITDYKFPDLDSDSPEIERLWALATIEKIQSRERIGKMPPSESEAAVRDLGLSYQIVTDFTSMVVLSDSAFVDRGVERHNQIRTAREQQAAWQAPASRANVTATAVPMPPPAPPTTNTVRSVRSREGEMVIAEP